MATNFRVIFLIISFVNIMELNLTRIEVEAAEIWNQIKNDLDQDDVAQWLYSTLTWWMEYWQEDDRVDEVIEKWLTAIGQPSKEIEIWNNNIINYVKLRLAHGLFILYYIKKDFPGMISMMDLFYNLQWDEKYLRGVKKDFDKHFTDIVWFYTTKI